MISKSLSMSATGITALHFLIFRGNEYQVTQLIESGEVDLDAADNGGQRPIHIACIKDHIGIVKKLVEAGADAKKADNAGNTPLHAAAATGAVQVLQYLLVEKGLSCDSRNLEGLTPLTLAERECPPRNKLAVLRLLREDGKEASAGEDANRSGIEQEERTEKNRSAVPGARGNGNRTSWESQPAAAPAAAGMSLTGLPDQQKENVAALYRVLRRQQKTIDALTEVVQTQARTIADLVASTASASKPSMEAKKVLPRDDIDIAVEIAAYSEEDVGAHRLLNRADDPARGEGDR